MSVVDLDAFLACYAEDATTALHVEALSRIEVGEFVVRHERVTGRGDPVEHVAVYLVPDDRIVHERLIGA
jgi:hypothetical protein